MKYCHILSMTNPKKQGPRRDFGSAGEKTGQKRNSRKTSLAKYDFKKSDRWYMRKCIYWFVIILLAKNDMNFIVRYIVRSIYVRVHYLGRTATSNNIFSAFDVESYLFCMSEVLDTRSDRSVHQNKTHHFSRYIFSH